MDLNQKTQVVGSEGFDIVLQATGALIDDIDNIKENYYDKDRFGSAIKEAEEKIDLIISQKTINNDALNADTSTGTKGLIKGINYGTINNGKIIVNNANYTPKKESENDGSDNGELEDDNTNNRTGAIVGINCGSIDNGEIIISHASAQSDGLLSSNDYKKIKNIENIDINHDNKLCDTEKGTVGLIKGINYGNIKEGEITIPTCQYEKDNNSNNSPGIIKEVENGIIKDGKIIIQNAHTVDKKIGLISDISHGSIEDGVINLPIASTDKLGLIKGIKLENDTTSRNITIDDGYFNIKGTNNGEFGLISGINFGSITNGEIEINEANYSIEDLENNKTGLIRGIKGIDEKGNEVNIGSISNGIININIAGQNQPGLISEEDQKAIFNLLKYNDNLSQINSEIQKLRNEIHGLGLIVMECHRGMANADSNIEDYMITPITDGIEGTKTFE